MSDIWKDNRSQLAGSIFPPRRKSCCKYRKGRMQISRREVLLNWIPHQCFAKEKWQIYMTLQPKVSESKTSKYSRDLLYRISCIVQRRFQELPILKMAESVYIPDRLLTKKLCFDLEIGIQSSTRTFRSWLFCISCVYIYISMTKHVQPTDAG